MQVLTAPFVGRLAVRVGFETVLRARIAATIVVVATLAVFADHEYVVIALVVVFGFTCTAVILTPLSSLGGIGFSLGFAWAGPMVGSGTDSTFQAAFWTCVGIGVVALAFSMILRPKPVVTEAVSPDGSTVHRTSP